MNYRISYPLPDKIMTAQYTCSSLTATQHFLRFGYTTVKGLPTELLRYDVSCHYIILFC